MWYEKVAMRWLRMPWGSGVRRLQLGPREIASTGGLRDLAPWLLAHRQ